MKTILKISFAFSMGLFSIESFSQQDAMVSQYMFNGMFLNPAYAGVRKSPNITAVYRKQWVRFTGAPETELLSYDQKFINKVGLGLSLSNDNIGVTGQTDIYANYSYHLELGQKHHIAFGLLGGVSNYRAKLTNLVVWDKDDEIYSRDIIGKWIPNFGSGVYYYTEKLYAGISVPRILSYNPSTFLHVEMNRSPQYERHYYLNGGYIIKANKDILVKPSLLVKYIADAPIQGDVNVNAYYRNIFGVGFSYRTKQGIVALLEFNTKQRIKIGYAFDYSFNKLGNYSDGTHEIMISYDFEKGLNTPMFSNSK